MKGKVEVFAIASDGSERLVISEPNLVVDGAGECIVNMLTTPSSTLKYAPRVMDTSNWRWGAISFGPAASSFQENAYFYPPDQMYTSGGDGCREGSVSVSSYINKQGLGGGYNANQALIRVLWLSSTIEPSYNATPSSYTPPFRLPSYPAPTDTKLEDASTAYTIVSGDGTQCYGQFENRIQFSATDASAYFQGAYSPRTAGGNKFLSGCLVSSYEGDWEADPFLHIINSNATTSGLVYNVGLGEYNGASCIDFRGYVSAIHNDNSIAEGLVYVSGSVDSDISGATSQVTVPKASMFTKIGCEDVWAMNLYGGLHNIGIWNVDCKKSLEKYEAPFLWDPQSPTSHALIGTNEFRNGAGVTKLEYKLFSKKTFTENLCANKDDSGNEGFFNPNSLKIVWTIDFRSDHD